MFLYCGVDVNVAWSGFSELPGPQSELCMTVLPAKMDRSLWCTAHCHTCFELRFVILCWPWLWKLWEQFHGSYWCPESLPLSKLPVCAEYPAADAGEADGTQRVPAGYVSQKVSPAFLGGESWPQLFGILTESWVSCWQEVFRLRIHGTAKFMVLRIHSLHLNAFSISRIHPQTSTCGLG